MKKRRLMCDNTDAIIALESLIDELKAGKLRIVDMESSTPVEEKGTRPFQESREFEPTGDVYIKLHFVRKTK